MTSLQGFHRWQKAVHIHHNTAERAQRLGVSLTVDANDLIVATFQGRELSRQVNAKLALDEAVSQMTVQLSGNNRRAVIDTKGQIVDFEDAGEDEGEDEAARQIAPSKPAR
jgi:hypothetical protein